jgi:hypothetical protein
MEVVIKSAAEESAEKPATNLSNVRTCLSRGSAAEICGALRLLLGDVFSLCLRTSRERVAKFVPAIASHFWTGVALEWPTQMDRDCCSCRAMVALLRSEQGIDQIIWIMRPSKLAGISKSLQDLPGENWQSADQSARHPRIHV